MTTASVVAHPAFEVAAVPRRIFGSFVEHMGRCVYTGIYEPTHPTADADGFRGDVLALTRELGVTVVRYPGGNFVSGYAWEDSVGPRSERPSRLDPAWHTLETNEFGLGEFMRWAGKADVEPMMALNLGTRGVREALQLVEYANHPSGTTLSDRRIADGATEPYGITMWCLGNELDGPWQTGHKSAEEYGRLAAETANALRQLDPGLELVACGSSNRQMPTFGAWENTVLEHAYDQVDYISLHAYYEEIDGDRASFLASAVDMDRFIESVAATADAVQARTRSAKRMKLSFDEWNVWYATRLEQGGRPTDWEPAPRLIEDEYSVLDAVVVGSLLISLLNHSDRVDAACQAQLVNVIGPIRSEPGGPAWRQTIFHPFALAARHCAGVVLRAAVTAPSITTGRYGAVPALGAAVTLDAATGSITVLAVNRDEHDSLELTVDLGAWGHVELVEALVLTDDDPEASNTLAEPDRVTPVELKTARADGGLVTADLPPISLAVLRLHAR